MKISRLILVGLQVCALLVGGRSARAEEEHHRATHLGSASGRFAAPLVSEKDLRWRFRDEALKPDILSILRQARWQGDPADLFNAALNNPVVEYPIAVGSVMPFMSTRVNKKPVILRNVTWAGAEPAPAYAFQFLSKGRLYRCVTPKACSNFFVEDLGLEPKPVLALDCNSTARVPLGRPARVCLTLRNSGNAAESNIVVELPVPPQTVVTNLADGGIASDGRVRWQLPLLEAGESREICLALVPSEIAPLAISASAKGAVAAGVQTTCACEVFGISAILLEKTDDPDPVSIGDTTTYDVKVTNQGAADAHNVQVVVVIAPELVPVSSPDGQIDGQTVTFPNVPTLGPKAAVSYKVVAKGVRSGDGHTRFNLSADLLKSAIYAEESTTVY